MLWKQFSRNSISPRNKENQQQQIMTKRRDNRTKISNRYQKLHESSSQLNIIENYQIQREIIAKFFKKSDPLFDETLFKCNAIDITSKLFKETSLDRTALFKERFIVGKQIGSGSYASVRICVEKDYLQQYALKIYNKSSLSSSRQKSILREIRILQMVKHNNIIKIYDAIETNNHLNLLLELIEGKALNATQFRQFSIKSIVYQIANALNYLHTKQITHRDIKLDNILITTEGNIKLIDFGFSTLLSNSVKKKIYCGTPSYMAPEIVKKQNYRGPPVDIWALGIILYNLKTGLFPFKASNDKELFYQIASGKYNLSLVDELNCQDLIYQMLLQDQHERITASQILTHQWFQQSIPYQIGRANKSNANSPRSQVQYTYQQIQSTVKKRDKVSVEFDNIYQIQNNNNNWDQYNNNINNNNNNNSNTEYKHDSTFTRKGFQISYMSSIASNKSPLMKRRQSNNQTFDKSNNSSMINQKL